MADEVGIDRAALETAAGELERVRADELVQDNESRELTEERSRLFVRFVSSLLTYLVVNVALYFLDRQLTGGAWVSYWVMFVWGLGLLFQLRNVLFPAHSLQRRKRRELKLAEREQRRAEREERRRRMHQAWNGGATPMFQAGRQRVRIRRASRCRRALVGRRTRKFTSMRAKPARGVQWLGNAPTSLARLCLPRPPPPHFCPAALSSHARCRRRRRPPQSQLRSHRE